MDIKELINTVINTIGDEYWDDTDYISFNGKQYELILVEELKTTDEGKFSCGSEIIGVYEKGSNEPLFYLRQDFTRMGSYYSDYDYIYDKPYLVSKVLKTIEVWE